MHAVARACMADTFWRGGSYCLESSVLLHELLVCNEISSQLKKGLARRPDGPYAPNWHVWVYAEGEDLDLGTLLAWHKNPARPKWVYLAEAAPPEWPLPLHMQPGAPPHISTDVMLNEASWLSLQSSPGPVVPDNQRLRRFWSKRPSASLRFRNELLKKHTRKT